VSLTTYFDADTDDLTRVLGVADAKNFHKSYGNPSGELWSPSRRLLTTSTRIPISRRRPVHPVKAS